MKKHIKSTRYVLASGPNGMIDYSPDYIQPPGIKATCHLHKEPQGFKSIEDLQQHELKEHKVWKG